MVEKIIKNFLLILVMQIIFTTLILFAASAIIWKCAAGENAISAVVIGTYIIVNFVGGIIAGRMFQKNRFLWGLAVGILYFAVVLCMGVLLFKTSKFGINIVNNGIICAISGMAGGMLSKG